MTKNQLSELIEESIQLELNMAELYKLFSGTYPEGNDFWRQLYLEEKSHAALIRTGHDSFMKHGDFPRDMISSSIEGLKTSNAKTEKLLADCKATPPDHHEACRLAIERESDVGEAHYAVFMNKDAANSLEAVFQQLNRADIDHEKRIQAHGLSLETTSD